MKNEVIQASVYGTDQEVVKSWRPGIGRVSTSAKNTDRGGSQKAYLLMVNSRGLEFNGVRCLSKAGQRRISFHLSLISKKVICGYLLKHIITYLYLPLFARVSDE